MYVIIFINKYICEKLIYCYQNLGETIVAEAQRVLLFTPVNEHKSGQSGVLFVTNFRLSFVTSREKHLSVN